MSKQESGVEWTETAYAKINLALHVRTRNSDGYHELETIFAFLDSGDDVSVESDTALKLNLSGPFSSTLNASDNLVLDAATLLREHSSTEKGAVINLDKKLPVASGIGGGSADAAATLRLLNRFWELDIPLEELVEISTPLGADVPACVLSQTCMGRGIGQDLTHLEDQSLNGYYLLLVNPLAPVSTGSVFAAWDGNDLGPLHGDTALNMALSGRNDLTLPAIKLEPSIRETLNTLEDTNSILSRMSGSGATCFALYKNEEQLATARDMVQHQLPAAWITSGSII
ncbi:4-(cytidine 5'-diphospho)-2-C-methyl-D-erythritol kinase [Parasphingorhabdus sp.]|uniref:4-(cytidine 5'-diphospho)-2-C-methyl-D-erythritol kinase n=1 Tax=Parasphingorhabdus sp. TaxID=2709688 RepID=UPI003262DCBC